MLIGIKGLCQSPTIISYQRLMFWQAKTRVEKMNLGNSIFFYYYKQVWAPVVQVPSVRVSPSWTHLPHLGSYRLMTNQGLPQAEKPTPPLWRSKFSRPNLSPPQTFPLTTQYLDCGCKCYPLQTWKPMPPLWCSKFSRPNLSPPPNFSPYYLVLGPQMQMLSALKNDCL